MKLMRLSKYDYLGALIAVTAFMGSFLGVFFGLAEGLMASMPNSDVPDAGLFIGPLAFIVALPAAWLGLYWCMRYFFGRTRQAHFRETFGYFGYLIFVAVAVTGAVGTFNPRAFVTIPVLLVSLAGAYLAARLLVARRFK